MMGRAVDIVVPVCNEVDSVAELYARVERLGLADALIFVDNGSTDGTAERLAALPRARVIRHATNQGWGASVCDGIAASDGACIVLIDGDLEYAPEAIPTLLEALQRAPVVYGSRFRGLRPPAMPLARRLGNRALSGVYNRLFRQHVTDFATGLKGLRRDAVPLARLRQRGWQHGAEIAALVALSGHRIEEIAVEYTPRQRGRSKLRPVREALKVIGYLLAYRLRGDI
jgi:glycosyltransferase involved in cell wall biosynthesis